MTDRQVEMLDTSALIPYVNNARTHNESQIKQIAASIKEFGWTNPVLIDEDNGIIAGHGRLEAAVLLNMPTVPCIRLTGLTEAQRKAYIIADNRLPLNAEWDMELLTLELQNLDEADIDLSLLGFSDDEMKDFLLNDVDMLDGMPDLPDGDKEPFQQMTFNLHDDQAETVKRAVEISKSLGPFEDTGNENRNGNALARICETFITYMQFQEEQQEEAS